MVILSNTLRFENDYVVGLGMLGWLWPLKTFGQFLENVTDHKIIQRWEYILIGVGGFISLALASYEHTFLAFTLPFSLSVAIVGVSMIFKALQFSKFESTVLTKITLCFMVLYFFNRAAFPYWGNSAVLRDYGLIWDLLLLIGFSASTFAELTESLKNKHEKELQKIVEERSDKLFGQSKYYDLGMMSAGVAHEINNPLAIIQAKTTQLLRVVNDPKKQKELAEGLQQILFTSERINKTIQGVREFVHQDERMPDTDIEIKILMEDVLAFCGQRMKNHGVNLRFYGLENHVIRGHKVQLEQVILNLFNNSFDAIEFLPDKWIEVSVQEADDKVQIFVKDSGSGISPEIASHMMDPFFTTKDMGKGTGLGLALAKGIVEKHHGMLSYIPHLQHTTFLIEFPVPPNEDHRWGHHENVIH